MGKRLDAGLEHAGSAVLAWPAGVVSSAACAADGRRGWLDRHRPLALTSRVAAQHRGRGLDAGLTVQSLFVFCQVCIWGCSTRLMGLVLHSPTCFRACQAPATPAP